MGDWSFGLLVRKHATIEAANATSVTVTVADGRLPVMSMTALAAPKQSAESKLYLEGSADMSNSNSTMVGHDVGSVELGHETFDGQRNDAKR